MQKTTNGGVNWFQQLGASFGPTKLFFLSKDTGWAACNNTNLYRTSNGGANWSLQFTFPQQIFDIYFFNKDIGVLTSGLNQRTTNGGFNWTATNGNGAKLSFVNDSVGWVGNNFSVVMKTKDGGKTWFNQTSPIFTAFSVEAIDTNIAWAGGSGLIHTTDGGGPTGIHQISNEIPLNYSLYQNYPNPFNPATNIKYSVKSETANVKIIVYDIQGREVMMLVNQKQSAGTYMVDFPGAGLSSGVYFYSLLTNGTVIATRKMILLK